MTGMAGNILPMEASGHPTDSPRSDEHQEDRAARHRGRISALFAAWIPSDREVHGMHAGALTFSCGILCYADIRPTGAAELI
jgi:hypothetical protein